MRKRVKNQLFLALGLPGLVGAAAVTILAGCSKFDTADEGGISFAGAISARALSHEEISIQIKKARGTQDQIVYRVYLAADLDNPTAEVSNEELVPSDGGTFSLTASGFESETKYELIVRAFDGQEEDDNKRVVEATTSEYTEEGADELPIFDGLLSATQVPTGVKLVWEAARDNRTSTEDIYYEVYRSEISLEQSFETPLFRTEPGATSHIDTSAELNKYYYYVVRAFDKQGNDDGNQKEKKVAYFQAILFDGISNAIGIAHDKVQVSFEKAQGGGGKPITYRIYRNGDLVNEFDNFIPPESTNSTASVILDNLEANTSYRFLVRADNGIGEDDNTIWRSAMTLNEVAPDFDGLTAAAPKAGVAGKSEILLTWMPATMTGGAISLYKIFSAAEGETIDFGAPIATVSSSATSFVVTGLSEGTTYQFAAHAVATSGVEELNQVIRLGTTNTSAAINFSGIGGGSPSLGVDGYTAIEIFWPPATGDFDQYNVYYSLTDPALLADADPFWNSPQRITQADSLALEVTGLTGVTDYYFVVRATNSITSVDDGNKKSAKIKTAPPLPTFDGLKTVTMATGVAGLTSLVLDWEPGAGAFNRYHIFQKVGGSYGDFSTPVGNIDRSLTDYTATGLTTGTEYCYVVRAVYDGVAPIAMETNLAEVCATPAYQTATFAGALNCSPAPGGLSAVAIDVNWNAAVGIFDKYKVWISTNPVIDFNGAESLQVDSNLTSARQLNLTPATTYYVGARALYSPIPEEDNNTIVRNCTTDTAFLVFNQITDGKTMGAGLFLQPTEVCLNDSSGNLIVYNTDITISLGGTPDGTLSGTTTRTSTGGCALFDDLAYDDIDQITFVATATGTVSTQAPVSIDNPPPPPGACAQETVGSWVTAYGGCYRVGQGLVMSSNRVAALWGQSIWEAPSSHASVQLHDLGSDADSDGLLDKIDPASAYLHSSTSGSTSGSCHSLTEGGYDDWRLPTLSEMQNLKTASYTTHWSYYHGTLILWTSTNDSSTKAWVTCQSDCSAMGGVQYTDKRSKTLESHKHFCVRVPETDYSPPQKPNSISAVAGSSTTIDAGWGIPSDGSYTGYAVYWIDRDSYDSFGILPEDQTPALIPVGTNTYTITGLDPNTEYVVLVRSVWTNANPDITDQNQDYLFVTTDP